jgi:hypothetical protein
MVQIGGIKTKVKVSVFCVLWLLYLFFQRCVQTRHENGRSKAKDHQMLRKVFMQSAFSNEEKTSGNASKSLIPICSDKRSCAVKFSNKFVNCQDYYHKIINHSDNFSCNWSVYRRNIRYDFKLRIILEWKRLTREIHL